MNTLILLAIAPRLGYIIFQTEIMDILVYTWKDVLMVAGDSILLFKIQVQVIIIIIFQMIMVDIQNSTFIIMMGNGIKLVPTLAGVILIQMSIQVRSMQGVHLIRSFPTLSIL